MKRLQQFTLLCFLFAHTALWAQEQENSPAPVEVPEGKVVRFGSWEQALTDLYYRSGAEFLKIDAPPYDRGNDLPLDSTRIRVYRKIGEGRSADNYEEVASFEAPAGAREVWVMLVASRNGKLHGVVTADDPDKFGRNMIRVLNVTPHPMFARLGDDNYRIDPLDALIVPATTDRKARQFYALAVNLGESQWEIVEKSFVGIPSTYRCTLIAAITEGFGLIRSDLHLDVLPLSEYVPEVP